MLVDCLQLMVVALGLGAWKRLYGIFLCSEMSEQFLEVVSALCCLEVLLSLVIRRDSSTFVLGEYPSKTKAIISYNLSHEPLYKLYIMLLMLKLAIN